MRICKLMPIDGRKSFHGKAKIVIYDDGTEVLYSYDTPIISKSKNGEFKKLWNSWSLTTGRHIKAFCGLNKGQYQMLEEEKKDEKIQGLYRLHCNS